MDLAGEVRMAAEQALAYHRAALLFFPGMFASRCNYDVAQGIDDGGQWRSGVLEQSWRIGGASGAEVGALHALQDDPELRMVRASTHEVYGDEAPRRPAPGSISTGWTSTAAGSSSMCRSNPMATYDEPVEIAVDAGSIAGTLITPRTLVPGILFVHGWGGSQEQYVARARKIAALGCVCLTFDLRGHAQTRPQFETVSRALNLRDVLAAYDLLARGGMSTRMPSRWWARATAGISRRS